VKSGHRVLPRVHRVTRRCAEGRLPSRDRSSNRVLTATSSTLLHSETTQPTSDARRRPIRRLPASVNRRVGFQASSWGLSSANAKQIRNDHESDDDESTETAGQ
jgi:hypothetical protein